MLNWLYRDIFLNQFLLGFIFYMLFREWLFPAMRRRIIKEGGAMMIKLVRLTTIWRHFKNQHGTKTVLECNARECASL